MKQERVQNSDWNDTGNAGFAPAEFSRSNSQVPEYPLPCDTEILSCDDDYPQVVARMRKLNCGWFQKSESGARGFSLSRIFKTQRLLVFGLVAIFASAGLLGTMFYYSGAESQKQRDAASGSGDQALLEGSTSQESFDSIPGQTPVGSSLFASPVISSEYEKSVLATAPAEHPVPGSWIQSGVAASTDSGIPAVESPAAVPTVATGSSAPLPVSVPQPPIQASASVVPAASSQPANPGWGDLSAGTSENRPLTQYSAGRPAENVSEGGVYPGGSQTMNAASPVPADIRLVSGQNNPVPNSAGSTHVIDENGQNIVNSPAVSSPMGSTMGSPAVPGSGSYDPNTNMVVNPYPQNQSIQPGQEPIRVATNPYASTPYVPNQPFNPQPSNSVYAPNPAGSVPSDVIATPMGQSAPIDSQSAASSVPFVAGENGFRGYSVDSSRQAAPTNYSSNPYLEKTDRIR